MDGNDLLNEVPSTINYEDLVNSGGFAAASRSSSKSESQKTAWLTRASELLDLSSGDSRDNTPHHESESYNQHQPNQLSGSTKSSAGQQKSEEGLIPQIVMNPWDPNQTPMMTLAPLANAVQAYQQHFLSIKAAQEGGSSSNDTGQEEDESYPLGKDKVLCVPPDEEMGFLINLPPPCNVLLQPSTVGLSGKPKESPFLNAFQRFLNGEVPTKTVEPLPEDARPPAAEEPQPLPGKKKYIPPYTPESALRAAAERRLREPPQKTPHKRSSGSTSRHAVNRSQASQSRSSATIHSFSQGVRGNVTPKKAKRELSDDELFEVESKFFSSFKIEISQ